MSGKYSVQLANLSSAAVDKLESLGMNVKFKEDDYGRGQFITCTSKFPIDNSKFPTVVDDQGLALDPDLVTQGSKVEAVLKTFDWEFKGKRGTSAFVQKMLVTELGQPSEDSFDYDNDLDAL
jgi:hypothetical protein